MEFLYAFVIVFTVIKSMDSICHQKCVCIKRVGLLQCTDFNLNEYTTFKGNMAWVKSIVFTTSIVDTDKLITHLTNLETVKLHGCEIINCHLKGCPKQSEPFHDGVIATTTENDETSTKDFKSSSSKSDVTLTLKTAVFDGYLSVAHQQTSSSSLNVPRHIYLLLVGIVSVLITIFAVVVSYLIYKYCCKKKVCRRKKTTPNNPDVSSFTGSDGETIFDRFENLGPDPEQNSGRLRSGTKYKKSE